MKIGSERERVSRPGHPDRGLQTPQRSSRRSSPSQRELSLSSRRPFIFLVYLVWLGALIKSDLVTRTRSYFDADADGLRARTGDKATLDDGQEFV